MNAQIIDIYPLKAQYLKGDKINVLTELKNYDEAATFLLEITISYLDTKIDRICKNIYLKKDEIKEIIIEILPRDDYFKGYGVDAFLYYNNEKISSLSTSFDVVSSSSKSIRYGFLSDFYLDDEIDENDVRLLTKLHINFIQFYDWMYRHDDLIPSCDYFTDLMGRNLSFNAVKNKIKYCHKYGIKAIAYGAVYAACRDYYEKNKENALYNSNGKNVDFINIFHIMNISKDCKWHNHIINEYKKAVLELDFDGIHMDTYGYPKTAFSINNNSYKTEYLQDHFPVLINDTKYELSKIKKDVAVIFNNVGNWPVYATAPTNQDAVYIEVWKPYERYHHIKEIISWAKHYGNSKPVILAAYLKPFKEENAQRAEFSALILTAVIASNGAYHLILGENKGILTQGYYVDYSTISDSFLRIIRNYYDFIIRYINLLYDNELVDVSMTHVAGDNTEYIIENVDYSTYGEANKLWITIKEKPLLKTISFINLTNNNEDYWNEGKNKPNNLQNIRICVLTERKIKGVFIASPDYNNGQVKNLEYHIENRDRGKYAVIDIPEIYIWSLLYISFEDKLIIGEE